MEGGGNMDTTSLLKSLIQVKADLERTILDMKEVMNWSRKLRQLGDCKNNHLRMYMEMLEELERLLDLSRREIERLDGLEDKQQGDGEKGCLCAVAPSAPAAAQPVPIQSEAAHGADDEFWQILQGCCLDRSVPGSPRKGSSAHAADTEKAVPPSAPPREPSSTPFTGTADTCGQAHEVDLRKVAFSAVAPKAFIKGEYTMIDMVMYEDAFRYVVDELLETADVPVRETRAGAVKVADGSSIRVTLTSPDLEMEDQEETGLWQGDYLHLSFAVELPEDYGKRQILFHANVYVNGVIAVRLKLIASCVSQSRQMLSVSRQDVLSAFVSYASQDRHRVAAIIQGMKKVRPDMDIFFDVDNLNSGDDWKCALYQEIDKRDVLFLCWSHFARQSEWVNKEWRYALAHKGLECIEPVPIDPPSVCPPPEELSKKHFNDKLLYIIHAEESCSSPAT